MAHIPTRTTAGAPGSGATVMAVPRPYLPPETKVQSSPTGLVHPQSATPVVRSTVHFLVTPELPEVVAYADSKGWRSQGWSSLMVCWQTLHWSTDGWATTHVLSSTDVPCPVMNGFFFLPGVPAGTTVEFALEVGLGCRDPSDTALLRDQGSLWFNDGGKNYRQVTR